MNFKKNFIVSSMLTALLVPYDAFSGWPCCCSGNKEEDEREKTQFAPSTVTTAPMSQTTSISTVPNPLMVTVSAPAIDDTITDAQAERQALVQHAMSPPTPPRVSQNAVTALQLSRAGIELKSLLSSEHTKIRASGNFTQDGQTIVNVIPEGLGGFLYYARRTSQVIQADDGSVDAALNEDPSLGVTANMKTELEKLRQTLNAFHDAGLLGSALDSVETTMKSSGRRIRKLTDEDGSIYLSTQDAERTFYSLGLIIRDNANFGLTLLSPSQTLSPPPRSHDSARRIEFTGTTEEEKKKQEQI